MYPSKPLYKRWWAIVSFIIGVSILFIMVIWSTKNAKHPASVNKIEPVELTPYDHLMEARKALMDRYIPDEDSLKTSWGRVYDARIHLEAIKDDSPEYAEAQRLMDELKRRETEMERILAVLTQLRQIRHKKGEKWVKIRQVKVVTP